jgi:hypothetical protein
MSTHQPALTDPPMVTVHTRSASEFVATVDPPSGPEHPWVQDTAGVRWRIRNSNITTEETKS